MCHDYNLGHPVNIHTHTHTHEQTAFEWLYDKAQAAQQKTSEQSYCNYRNRTHYMRAISISQISSKIKF